MPLRVIHSLPPLLPLTVPALPLEAAYRPHTTEASHTTRASHSFAHGSVSVNGLAMLPPVATLLQKPAEKFTQQHHSTTVSGRRVDSQTYAPSKQRNDKPLPAPPADSASLPLHAPQPRRGHKGPLADVSTNAAMPRRLARTRSFEKAPARYSTQKVAAFGRGLEPTDFVLTAPPRSAPALGFRIESAFTGAEDSAESSDDEDIIASNADKSYSLPHFKVIKRKESHKHKHVLNKFRDAITDRFPAISTGSRRRQKRHTVISGGTTTPAEPEDAPPDPEGDLQRRIAETRNFGSPKLQRMFRSARKHESFSSPGALYPPRFSDHDDSPVLARSSRALTRFSDPEREDPFVEAFVTAAGPPAYAIPAMTPEPALCGLGLISSPPEVAAENLSRMSLEAVPDKVASPTLRRSNIPHQILPFTIYVSGLRQHTNVLDFAKPPPGVVVVVPAFAEYASLAEQYRRNGLQLTQSPLKRVHILSNASSRYEYAPEQALWVDGAGVYRNWADMPATPTHFQPVPYPSFARHTHSQKRSDGSKRSSQEAGLPADAKPCKRNKVGFSGEECGRRTSPGAQDGRYLDGGRRDCDDDAHLRMSLDYLDKQLIPEDGVAEGSVISYDEEPQLGVARSVQQPGAMHRRMSGFYRGRLISVPASRWSPNSSATFSHRKEAVDELQATDLRYHVSFRG